MKPIYKFILHVVHNWKNELNEAYSEGTIRKFIEKFKEEADDLNISISDNQLKRYINIFDRIKEKLPGDQRDLSKWTVSKLIKLTTSVKPTAGEDDTEEEEIDITPDVVYHNEDNTIAIYKGSNNDNCVTYGRGEKWCITRGSFPSYRFSQGRAFPVFYLAKNNNLPSSDSLSFVAIQVRDPQMTEEDERYVYTNRRNSPYESRSMSFSSLLNEIPWLKNIPNLKSILKYIPLTNAEKTTQLYKGTAINYREWVKLPFNVKQQYLVIRKDLQKFVDVSDKEFVEKYLPKYPELAKFIAETPGIFKSIDLLANLDKFPNQIRRSITANLRDNIKMSLLAESTLPFDVKKLLVQLDKWDLPSNQRLYVTKDGESIVKLTLGNELSVGIYQEDSDFPNIKLNKRTVKYLLDYPELDKIPLNILLKLTDNQIIDSSIVNKVLNDSSKDPDSAFIIKSYGDKGKIIIDTNTFTSFTQDSENKIKGIPFSSVEVQQILNDSNENEKLQANVFKFFEDDDIPVTADKDSLLSIVRSTPLDKRTANGKVLLTSDSEGSTSFFFAEVNPMRDVQYFLKFHEGYKTPDWKDRKFGEFYNDDEFKSYFTYLRQKNTVIDQGTLLSILRVEVWGDGRSAKKNFIKNNPPVDPNSQYKPVMYNNTAYLVNTADSRSSFKVSDTSGKLIRASIPPSQVRQMLGGQGTTPQAQPQAQTQPQVRRRGRPAGVRNAVRQPAAPAAPAGGNINVSDRMEEVGLDTAFLRLSRSDYRRLNRGEATSVNPNGDRGAARRNNLLGNRGRVEQVIQVGASKIYIIRLANQQIVASINIQPGNRNYVLFGNRGGNIAQSLNSPTELLQALQNRNLAEIHHYIVNEYLGDNPTHLDEFKKLLRKHINEKRNARK